MWNKLWNRIRGWFTPSNTGGQLLMKELVINEYRSVLYAVHHAQNLQQLLEARKRVRAFHQLLIENRLEFWGRTYVTDLNKLWNAKFQYWKHKARG